MKLLSIAVLLVLCALTKAISFSTMATVALSLLSLNKPVTCFFGIFRRRKTPPIQETVDLPPEFFPNNPMSNGMFNNFGGMFVPGLGNPQFSMFGNRFPPQVKPPGMPAQKPPMPPMHQGFPQGMQQQAMQHAMQQQAMQNAMQQQGMQQHAMQQFPPQMPPMNFPPGTGEFNDVQSDDEGTPGMNTEEAESFFTLLSETDESKCISRLVCEMGANPSSGGEFGQSIVEIIGSLKDFPDGSKVSEFNEVLNIGMTEGLSACSSKYSICDNESFEMVKKAQLEDEGQSK